MTPESIQTQWSCGTNPGPSPSSTMQLDPVQVPFPPPPKPPCRPTRLERKISVNERSAFSMVAGPRCHSFRVVRLLHARGHRHSGTASYLRPGNYSSHNAAGRPRSFKRRSLLLRGVQNRSWNHGALGGLCAGRSADSRGSRMGLTTDQLSVGNYLEGDHDDGHHQRNSVSSQRHGAPE